MVASSREKVLPILVERHCHNSTGTKEGLFDAVSVVDVDINVEDSWVVSKIFNWLKTCVPQQLQDAEDNIVDVAKARGLTFLGMVETASPVDADVVLAVVDKLSAVEGAAYSVKIVWRV